MSTKAPGRLLIQWLFGSFFIRSFSHSFFLSFFLRSFLIHPPSHPLLKSFLHIILSFFLSFVVSSFCYSSIQSGICLLFNQLIYSFTGWCGVREMHGYHTTTRAAVVQQPLMQAFPSLVINMLIDFMTLPTAASEQWKHTSCPQPKRVCCIIHVLHSSLSLRLNNLPSHRNPSGLANDIFYKHDSGRKYHP